MPTKAYRWSVLICFFATVPIAGVLPNISHGGHLGQDIPGRLMLVEQFTSTN